MTGPRRDLRVVVYGTAAAAFVSFAIWGSLFPFDFSPVPLRVALELFWIPWQSSAASWSINDLTSNVMLFVPIGLFVTATLDSAFARATPRRAAAIAAAAFAILLSVALEVSQAYVPDRTPSAVDVMAELLGAIAGAAVWYAGATPSTPGCPPRRRPGALVDAQASPPRVQRPVRHRLAAPS
jgi:glycopeptide antibiotics resistance protein